MNDLAADLRRVVIKLGSSTLCVADGAPDTAFIHDLAAQITRLTRQGCKVIVVSSGAIAAGSHTIDINGRPHTIPQKQAAAAIGQGLLMHTYSEAFAAEGQTTAQILLTRYDLQERARYVNASNTLQALLKYDVVPIVNENDTVAVEEIKFGDNDTLAAMVAGLADADLLINLSDVDGLFDKNPSEHADAKLIPIVKRIDRGVEDIAEGTSTHVGTGGMSTKIKAAKMCSQIGITMIVANGRQPDAIAKAIAGECGTRFLPYHKSTLRPRQRWIAFGAAVRGTITVNVGARVQVVEGGKSLLPAGIVDVAGRFRSGEMVKLVDESGKAFAQGFVNYDHESLRQIMGLHTAEISDVLGSKPSDEVVHRDNMVFTFS